MRHIVCLIGLLAAALSTASTSADMYLEPAAFVSEAFAGDPPAPRIIWLTGEVKSKVRGILGHDYPSLRLRYWVRDGRSAWVLDEIGKDLPITAGIVIDDRRIERLRVLVFRESRGWEVRYPFFTEQFDSAALGADLDLDRDIDGISGATLSVGAVERLARLALYLHGLTVSADVDP